MKEYIVTEHPDFPYEEPKPQELIRCKDCAWYEPYNGADGNCARVDIDTFDMGYCSWAERKKHETD